MGFTSLQPLNQLSLMHNILGPSHQNSFFFFNFNKLVRLQIDFSIEKNSIGLDLRVNSKIYTLGINIRVTNEFKNLAQGDHGTSYPGVV